MQLSELFIKDIIDLDLHTKTKNDTLQYLATRFAETGGLSDVEGYVANLQQRELQSSTGVGDNIAIPHAQHESIQKASIIFGRSQEGIEWASFDNQPAKLIFMIAAPEGSGAEHLKALARLSKVLMNEQARELLLQSETPEEIIAIIQQYDKVAKEEILEENVSKEDEHKPYILAVTACPTGIAHTFMAAEKLEQAGKAAGVAIKVETNGQGGIGNKLSAKDIKQATAIIVAADKNVEMARFNGKPVIITKVSDGIHKADELVAQAIKGQAPIYKADDTREVLGQDISQESLGRRAYKHLMNGISHMLPFVVAGGILIALSFFWGIESFNPDHPSYNIIAHTLFTLGKLSMAMMLPVLAGFIGHSIADRPGLVVGFMGGILADPSVLSGSTDLVKALDMRPSGFLGALVAGFLAGGIIIVLRKVFSVLPKSLEGLKPIFLFPILGTLLMGVLMILVFNAPMAMITTSLIEFINSIPTEWKVVVGFIVGGMMAIDMGGPINKAAYATGTALVTAAASGVGSDVMAAVMVGGMVPPMAIFLSALIKSDLWPESQRDSALVNCVMGAAFITEGAIPFAASNPLRVIPALAISSGVAGALSMLFGIRSVVPHGGLFATMVNGISNAPLYILVWLIGSFIGAGLLIAFMGFSKRKAN
ncbi:MULTISPECIES: fructose-specific PTS transporter subunit EIIC [unclassified Granulicatella]|uniref:PTS fructose transporter subunit IIABC n=1 Tax=unclassified Granulicatella TaxID=2630493 RepID=UPI00107407C8|nr:MULTISPECIES: fructose-specific PTS transporter subunit EIIC [unclassified Granulicatella]MBF0779668.1 PTS sugar transporter subunit IIA [Granulicatella sp. 19428wC4_WM01]TFU96323.1 PTS fructose transporter subunit IIC [Granulicatella sp. WM01]